MEGFVNERPSVEKKFEHLNAGVVPIMACVERVQDAEMPDLSVPITHVNLYQDENEAREQGLIKEGERSFVISQVDGASKFSDNYKNCTGIVASGTDAVTGENISFVSHQNPSYVLHEAKESFTQALHSTLEQLKTRSVPGSIDAVILGGNYMKAQGFDDDHPIQDFFTGEYVDSIRLLSDEISGVLGFVPTVIMGPKFSPAVEHVAYDNAGRRLFLIRSGEDPGFVGSYVADELDTVRESWVPGEVDSRRLLDN